MSRTSRAAPALPFVLAVAIALVMLHSHLFAAELAGFPEISTDFTFRSEDYTNPDSDRTIAIFRVALSSALGFETPSLGGRLSIGYAGNLQDTETVLSALSEVRSNQSYKVNLGLATKDRKLTFGSELSTRDTYFRRDRFDSLLSTETYQNVSGTMTVAVPPYPTFTGAISNERSVSLKVNPISSSQTTSAAVTGTWGSGPLQMSISKSRLESRNDVFDRPATVTEQTLVNAAAAFPLGPQWTMTNVFVYTENDRNLLFLSGGSDKSMISTVQTSFTGTDLAPGLSTRIELRGESRTFTNETSNSASFLQSASLTYKMPGEILGDDRWTMQFTNADTDSGGRSINVRNHALSWQFFPAQGASVSAVYGGQVSTDNNLNRKNEERSNFDLRFGFVQSKLNIQGTYRFQLVEGSAGQQSRSNTAGLQATYQASDKLTLSTAINQAEDRNIPASPLGRVNVSDKTAWSFGAAYRPLPEMTINSSYSTDVQDNTAGNRTDSRRLRFDMNYDITRQIRLIFRYDNTDYTRFGDPGAGFSNSIVETQVFFSF